jgi:hypothetical protein
MKVMRDLACIRAWFAAGHLRRASWWFLFELVFIDS